MINICFNVCLSAQPCLTVCDPLDVALQAPLSMGFSWQKYWRGLLFPPLGDFPDPEIKPVSFVSPTLQADSLPLSRKGSPFFLIGMLKIIGILKVKVKVKSLSRV